MDVAVTDLRAHLSAWLDRVQAGEELVITERGIPVARVSGLATTGELERLVAAGAVAMPTTAARPRVTGSRRPRAKRPVADRISEQRR